ncbi:MAG TPA: DNA methyltransferase, partial [Balneolales bacterium]|nr:DNA methyltransferase [Balneolales bacterium]
YKPTGTRGWRTSIKGIKRLDKLNRLWIAGNTLRFKRYFTDNPLIYLHNLWTDTGVGFGQTKQFVVQTNTKILERCLLMTTDPGDLVLDPTCGSGTTAYIAEQWGRRWITIETSRIAINIAKTRLMTATYPYYFLHSETKVQKQQTKDGGIKKDVQYKPEKDQVQDVRQGFVYEEVPHITLKQLANDEPPETETLYDKPFVDKKKLRVSGPFTVETLQNYEPVSPDQIEDTARSDEDSQQFEELVFEHLKSAGVKNGIKNEQAQFKRVESLGDVWLNAEGFYDTDQGERKAYLHIGPRFGTVSKEAVNNAVKECRARGDADWLIILGFSFESEIQNQTLTTSMGSFEVTKVRMHDDLLQQGLLKKDKKAASFVTIGEPDITVTSIENGETDTYKVEILGLDIYDPIKDQIKARNRKDIAYWMVDDDYDGSNFVAKQLFFCGGSKDEFKSWKKGLNDLAKQSQKRNTERTLKIEIDDEAFDRLYGFKSHPIKKKQEGQKVAVRVISQFGEESTKVVGM